MTDRLARLRSQYIELLDNELANLTRALTALRSSPDEAAIEALLQVTHRIRGTAGTFGYNRVGTSMRELEALCGELRDGKRSADEVFFAALDGALRAAQRDAASKRT